MLNSGTVTQRPVFPLSATVDFLSGQTDPVSSKFKFSGFPLPRQDPVSPSPLLRAPGDNPSESLCELQHGLPCPLVLAGSGQWEPWRRREERRALFLWLPPGCDGLAVRSEGRSLRWSLEFSPPQCPETHPPSPLQEFAPVSSCPVGFSADTLLRNLLLKFSSSSPIFRFLGVSCHDQ